jgi:hypothetical protein
VEALRDGEVIGVVPSFRTLQNTLRRRACEDQREPHASNETQAQRLMFAQGTAHVQWPLLVDIDCSVGDRERSIDRSVGDRERSIDLREIVRIVLQ